MEKDLINYKLKLEHSSLNEHAFYAAKEACPCILHLENHHGLAMMNLLCVEGNSNCDDGLLHPNVGRSFSARWKECVRIVEEVVNTNILGNVENPSQ